MRRLGDLLATEYTRLGHAFVTEKQGAAISKSPFSEVGGLENAAP